MFSIFLLTDDRGVDEHAALFLIVDGRLIRKSFDESLDSPRIPLSGLQQFVSNVICAYRGIFPYNLHNFIFSFGNLGNVFHRLYSFNTTLVITV